METEKLTTKKYTKKNGEEVVKQYNQSTYNKTYYEKNKEKLAEKVVCGCGLDYLVSNKSNHRSGRVHKLWQKLTKEV
jgi:hypothetical protein|tara:strand:- start:3239 stop:3469 length:231 start_codon:yes stop_codon:yes gene_type:complete